MRVRSHAEQNERVTEAMMPTVAGPPSTSHSSAGADGSSRPASVEREPPREHLEQLGRGHHVRAAPGGVGIQRHLLDEPQPQTALDRPREQRGRVLEGLAHRARR